MQRTEIESLLSQAEKRFEQEPKLIEIPSGRVIFVGDTHGDIEATRSVVERYLKPENTLVFLGDYVDRGSASAENLHTLLTLKLEYPENLFLLMGNHEGQKAMRFHPADFWQRLDDESFEWYAEVLSKLPLAVSTPNGIVAVHGALPGVQTLSELSAIFVGSELWQQITWGDWREEPGGYLGEGLMSGRPQFGQGWFEEIMARLGKNVLIRSHQPDASPVMFSGRCLTIFTSSAYRSVVSGRTIAIADLSREVRTVDDLVMERV